MITDFLSRRLGLGDLVARVRSTGDPALTAALLMLALLFVAAALVADPIAKGAILAWAIFP
jgi:hypothetical protein